MQKIHINELTPHSRNIEFFDDMTGEKWNEFLKSVKSRGVIEPVIITQDKVIVSGHQRVRACKELGIKDVLCETRIYNNEDEILQDLIETNVRQRGDVGGSQLKLGRRIVELERLYGIKHGNNQCNKDVDLSNGQVLSQEQLAEKLGVSIPVLQRAKKLTTLPQEIQDMIEEGTITSSTASRVIAKLSDEEQQKLINILAENGNIYISAKKMEEYIEKIKSLENELAERPTIEVIPSDYNKLKTDIKNMENKVELAERSQKATEDQLENLQHLYDMEVSALKEDADKYKFVEDNVVNSMRHDEFTDIEKDRQLRLLYTDVVELIENKLAPVKYKNYKDILDRDDILRNNFRELLDSVMEWVADMEQLINKTEYVEVL